LALPCGISTPILNTPSSVLGIGTVVGEKVGEVLAASGLHPTVVTSSALIATELMNSGGERRIHGL
jgi:hypothetical protein